jgi:hypothetical protein
MRDDKDEDEILFSFGGSRVNVPGEYHAKSLRISGFIFAMCRKNY